ncbi:hypothetical protein SEUCBS140593_001841 [Sporothrix eucalyptigena]|uniref:Cytochrome P450 oxidoreductase n=1 Tax=Sporothrix eucalyptigena TaxID=1812306 RepID=A0ABP0B1M4_9PEZI
MSIPNALEPSQLAMDFVSQHWPILVSVAILSSILGRRYLTPLRKIPGPFFASWTRFPRIFAVTIGKPHEWELKLHRKYGRIVRTGPDQVSVGDPAMINVIYNANDKFKKSPFYIPFMVYDEEGMLPDPLVISDKALHTRMKKNAYTAYSMGAMLQLEPLVDAVTDRFFALLNKRPTCDLGKWLRFYATDGDPIGMMPVLELVLGSNGLDGAALELAMKQVNKFREKMRADKVTGPCTFVQRLLEHQKKDPHSITDRELNTHAFGNITAGADTTAIAMRTIMFNVAKNPAVYRALCHEIRDEAKLTLPVSYAAASALPYLDAVIKESLRIHPPNGVMYCRTVPAGGATICGKFLPGGTEVGVSPWVVHYDEELFPEPEKFHPERWLAPDDGLVALRKRSIFAFSAGSHTCLGKNISLMEITKLIASLLVRYDIALEDPEAKLSFKCRWFTPQKGLNVKITRRK